MHALLNIRQLTLSSTHSLTHDRRDFFPDIPKMKSQIEWMEAVRSGDESRIVQAQINIAHRRAGLKTPSLSHSSHDGLGSQTPAPLSSGATPSALRPSAGGIWAATPRSALGNNIHHQETPAMTPLRINDPGVPSPSLSQGGVSMAAAVKALAEATGSRMKAPNMSLDAYLAKTTSEDNADFAKLLSEEHSRKRIKYGHHLEDKNKPLMIKSSAGEEYGSSGQNPMTLAFPKHVALNSLYYNKDGAKLSEREIEERAKGPPKQIVLKNTRLASSTVEDPVDEEIAEMLTGSTSWAGHQVDEGQERQHGGVTGHLARRLATPSFTPGPGFSPLMTWGNIDSTPMRLDGAGGSIEAGGPFKVQEVSHREKTLHQLVESKSKAGSLKSKVASLPGGVARSPHLSLSKQSKQPLLSPAAHSLAAKIAGGKTPLIAGGSGGVYNDLRASYSGMDHSKIRGVTPTPSLRGTTPH